MRAYYNENDLYAAAWLRELIRAGLIAPGDVDDRSIAEVRPDDMRGYTQCHFFAGIGGWSYALRLAGWDDSRPVWTGSCPCQPFSIAGKRAGIADERHLWPEFRRLIEECSPPVVFGEQVAGSDGRAWLARVRADLEALGYAVGAADLCAAGIAAPHKRQRLYWVGDAESERCGKAWAADAGCAQRITGTGAIDRMADAEIIGCGQRHEEPFWSDGGSGAHTRLRSLHGGATGRLGDTSRPGLAQREIFGGAPSEADFGTSRQSLFSGSDVVQCRDGNRRFESGAFPLVDGLPREMVRMRDEGAPFHPAEARTMRLRGYGNAIVPQVAAEFIAAYVEASE